MKNKHIKNQNQEKNTQVRNIRNKKGIYYNYDMTEIFTKELL